MIKPDDRKGARPSKYTLMWLDIWNFWPMVFRKWLGIVDVEKDIEKIHSLLEAQETLVGMKFKQLDTMLYDLVRIGVDVHFKKPHQIMIWSALNGGQFRSIAIDIDNMQDLRNVVFELKERYGIKDKTLWDAPPELKQDI